jgi:Amidohydrolase family
MHDSTHAFRLAEWIFFNDKIASRAASYNPFVSLYWLVSGRAVGRTAMYAQKDRLDRMEALRCYTVDSARFSGDEMHKGTRATGMLGDFAVLSDDYFAIDEDEIRHHESVMTVVTGHIVYGADEFAPRGPPPLPVIPSWSPVAEFVGYRPYSPAGDTQRACTDGRATLCGVRGHWHGFVWRSPVPVGDVNAFWGALGCSCFAF